MPLDHYVSQVHLRNFYSASEDCLRAIMKSDLRAFPCRSEDVCRIKDGSTNPFLEESRAIEQFLLKVEPKYNTSIDKLRRNSLDDECIFAIAGFVAFVLSCSPAGMRIHSGMLRSVVETTAAMREKRGLVPKAPAELGGKSLTELLDNGTVRVDVDPKFPQALGISTIMERTWLFGNSRWEILRNDDPDSPFFSSDFPVAIEVARNSCILNRVVSLAPDLALRIIPDPRLSKAEQDQSFARLRHVQRRLTRAGVVHVNRLLVQCAEDIVFYRDERGWIPSFVAKYRGYRIEPIEQRVPSGGGFLIVSSQRIKAFQSGA